MGIKRVCGSTERLLKRRQRVEEGHSASLLLPETLKRPLLCHREGGRGWMVEERKRPADHGMEPSGPQAIVFIITQDTISLSLQQFLLC